METKKLYKSREKMIAGVCGGIAEYINIDPTLVRLAWVLLFFAGCTGLLAYIVAAIIMPEKPAELN
ncbi:MAG TPA: PspC domain-containing protein [Clostridiaceae bacterium]|jgi:phage shock protein C|nr:PspC domain-containing protein [Clostridiaceae bacterium]HHT92716.1 PspC domain-containing protein [Clostridiaceae bacterium]